MASEITVTSKLAASKSSTSVANLTSSYTIDMAGAQMHHSNPVVSNTAAALSCTPVDQTARYHLWIRNTDGTNEVLVSFNGGSTYPLVILPGKTMGPITVAASMTLWLDPQGADCTCEVIAVEI
jgi:hypothetical protein